MSEVATCSLDSLVAIDPESLPVGTDPSCQFFYFDISSATNGRLQMPETAITYTEAPSRARRVVKNGDVLMSTVRPNLKAFAYCKLPEDRFVASTGFSVLRALNGNDPRFVLYSILSDDVTRQIESHVVGSNYPAINSSDVRRLKIPAWKPATQRRIATILATLDEVIEATENLVEKHQQIKAGLMHDLFTRGLWTRPELARGDHKGLPCEATAEEGQLRPTPEEAPGLYQDSPLGPIPKVWEAASLLSISNSMTNGFVGTATPYYSEDEDAIQYLYGNNVRADKLELPSSMRVTRRFHELQRKSQLQPGDMLTVQSGHIGTSAIVPESLGEANCHALIITKFKTSRVVPDFVSHYCNSPGGYQRLGSIFVGSTILHINVKEFKNFAIPLPQDLREQERICDRLVAINERIDAENTHLAKLRQQKQGLMHDLLTGRVRVD